MCYNLAMKKVIIVHGWGGNPSGDWFPWLEKKLEEESKEFSEAGSSEELADVIEVIEDLKKLPDYAGVEELRKKKSEERGAFDLRIILKGEK